MSLEKTDKHTSSFSRHRWRHVFRYVEDSNALLPNSWLGNAPLLTEISIAPTIQKNQNKILPNAFDNNLPLLSLVTSIEAHDDLEIITDARPQCRACLLS